MKYSMYANVPRVRGGGKDRIQSPPFPKAKTTPKSKTKKGGRKK